MKMRALLFFLVLSTVSARAGTPVEDFLNTLFSRSHQYVCLGKILASPPETNVSSFYKEMLRMLLSPDLLEAARRRVAKQHPEMKAGTVEIKVMRSEGSSLIRIAAVGDQQKYTRQLLDALLDEWAEQDQAAVMAGPADCLARLRQQLSATEKDCMGAEARRTAAAKSGAATGELDGAFEKAKAAHEAARLRLEKYDVRPEILHRNAIMERPLVAIPTR